MSGRILRLSYRILATTGLVITAAVFVVAPAVAQSGPEGQWEGAINVPGREMKFSVEIKKADSGFQGSINVVGQGILPLKTIQYDAPKIAFGLEPAPGMIISFEGKQEGDKITGQMNQAGMSFPFTLARAVAAAVPVLPEGMIPRELLFGNPEKTAPQISPDGARLAYLAPDKGVLNVWVRTIGKDDDAVVTSDKKRGVRSYFWQADSKHILYIQDRDGDENWHLYQTHLESRNTRDLTPFEGIQAQIAGTDERFPNALLVGMNLRDRKFHDVYRLNLKNGALEMDTVNPGDVLGFVADQKFQIRASTGTTADGGVLVKVRDTMKSPWREFRKWASEDAFGGAVGFSPDNKSLWMTSSQGANTYRLVEAALTTGKETVVAEDKLYDIGGAMVNPKSKRLEAVAFTRARTEWQLIDKTLQADFDALRKVRDGDFNVASRDLADKTWIVSYDLDNAPVTFYAYDRATRQATYLFTNRPKLEKFKLANIKPVSFTARDGMTIHGYLTVPADSSGKNLPMVLNVHGGPWGRDTWGYDGEVQWLANRGYAVLQINFRGSTGYGKAFVNAGDREWGVKMHYDLLDGKQWAIQQGAADPQKICIYGGSYGGYATLVGVAFTPDEFSCGVDIVGPSNLVTLLKSIPPYWESFRAIFRKRVGHEETEKEFLESRSPLFKADQIKVPLLIAQGANDPRVKQAESDQIVAAMRKNKKPVEYIVFPDEGHGFARPENRLKFYAAAEQFLAKYLGGRAQPASAADKWDDLKK